MLVGTALYVGGTLLAQALAPKQKDPGVSLTMQIGGDSPLSFFVGTAATAGHRVYAGAWGNEGQTPNAYFVDVLELANAPLDGLSNVYVNGELATVRWSEPHPDYGYPISQGRKGGRDHLWIKFHDGRQAVADPYLVSKFSGSERPYGADRIGLGNAYAVVTVRYNRELWKSGAPKMLFEVRGLRLYDIRKDSSAGGVGTHRRNNPATWEWTDNPYVIAYNVAFMGVYVGSEWLWGLQNLPALRLPTSAWVAAMNEADRTLAAWEGQRQFTIGGEITVDMEPAAVLEEIAKSSLGRFIESAGSYKPRCGAPGTSVYSFGEADLLITDPRTVTPFPGLEATHNTVEASYTEPGEAWGWKPAPVQSNPAYIAADGNRTLSAGLRFPMVSRNEQVQRLAYSYLEDGRRFRQFRASFHPITWLLEPGDVIDGTILSEGYSGKQFEILEMSGRRSFVQTMTLREIDPADFDPPSSARQDWSVGTIQTIYPPAQVVTGWAVSPYAHVDSESRARRPGIQCFYQGGMDDIRDIKIMIRRPGEAEPFFSQPYPYDADNLTPSVIIVGESILGNEPYQVASIFVPFSPRDMEVSDWLAVTTPDVRIEAVDFAADIRPVEIIDTLPSLGNFEGRIVFLTSDHKLYRHTGSPSGATGFTAEVPADDISGTIADSQIAALAASKITGQLTDAQIADLDAAKLAGTLSPDRIGTGSILTAKLADSAITTEKLANEAVEAGNLASGAVTVQKFASGLTPVEIVSVLPTTGNYVGRTVFFDGDLYRHTGSPVGAAGFTKAVDAGDIEGVINDAQIAGVAASKITGQLADGQIEAVAAAKVTGQIVGTQISDEAISTPKLAAGAVTTAKIDAGAVTADEIAANAITSGKISAGAVETAKIAAGAIEAQNIASGAVTTAKLDALAVTTEKLAAGSVVADKVAAGAIETGHLDAAAVTADKLAAGAVEAGKIAAGAVETASLAAGAVTTAKLDALSVTTAKLAAGAVEADKIAANAVTTIKLDALAVTTEKIAASAVVSDKIDANAVTAGKIAAGAIEAAKIAAGAVETDKLAASAVTAAKIDALAVTSDKLAANAVTAGKIAAGAVSTDQLAANAVSTDKLVAGAVTADKMDVASIFAVNANITGTLQVGTGATGVFIDGANNRILIVDGT